MFKTARRISAMKKISFIILGVIFPVLMLGASVYNLHTTSNRLFQLNAQRSAVAEMRSIQELTKTPNDYVIFSMMYLEQQTHDALILKQIMKITSMYIGYAVLSIGIMMIFLGVETKEQNDINGNFMGLTFNVKTGSAGVVVFLFGSIMTLMPAVLANKYQTPGIPNFASSVIGTSISGDDKNKEYISEVMSIYALCEAENKGEQNACFQQSIIKNFGG